MAATTRKTLTSKILDTIRAEVISTRGAGPVSTDYYAQQGKPKDGGYAKCNYVKGDGIRINPADVVSKRNLAIRVRPNIKTRGR